jgi:hypothetical protein
VPPRQPLQALVLLGSALVLLMLVVLVVLVLLMLVVPLPVLVAGAVRVQQTLWPPPQPSASHGGRSSSSCT